MKKIKVAIIGAGNISNTRHIPSLIKLSYVDIVGIVSDDTKKIERTKSKYPRIKNSLYIDSKQDLQSQLEKCEWFADEVEAVVIGTPPKQHFPLVRAALNMNKHTLVEKPMMMCEDECEIVSKLAREKNLILYVNHSFQYADGIVKLDKKVKSGELGEIESILELQMTNRARRLPVWYDDLPLGLFYDEAAHFFYGAMRFGSGDLQVLNAHARKHEVGQNTPRFLEVQLEAGDTPVQMYMNFNSPICEWALILMGKKKIAIYDYFKDILVVLNNDKEHLAKNVLKTSLSFFTQFWKGFIGNGLKMLTGKLLYGHDKCIEKFINAVQGHEVDDKLDSTIGSQVVRAMNQVVEMTNCEYEKR